MSTLDSILDWVGLANVSDEDRPRVSLLTLLGAAETTHSRVTAILAAEQWTRVPRSGPSTGSRLRRRNEVRLACASHQMRSGHGAQLASAALTAVAAPHGKDE